MDFAYDGGDAGMDGDDDFTLDIDDGDDVKDDFDFDINTGANVRFYPASHNYFAGSVGNGSRLTSRHCTPALILTIKGQWQR
jgi:hypothetical protein